MYEDLLEEQKLKPYWDTLKVLDLLFKKYNNHERIFFSMDHFAEQHRILTGKNTGKGTLGRKLAYLALLKVIERENPNNAWGLTAENAVFMKETLDRQSFTTFYRQIKYQVPEALQRLERAKVKGISLRNFTYEVIQSQYSTEVASQCFPGRYKHRQSKKTREALKVLEEYMKDRDIVSVKELKVYLYDFGYKGGSVDKFLKAFQPEGFKLVRYTKQLKDRGTYQTNERVFIRL